MLAILLLPLCELALLGILSGIVGTMTVLRGRVFFAESITHGAFPGAVIGVVCASVFTRDHSILALCVFLGALGLCLPLSALMSVLARIPGVSSGAAAGVVLTFSFALGYFLSKWFAPLPLQISSFLTGSIMTVTPMDIALAGAATLGALCLLGLRGRHILFLSFDVQGYRAAFRSYHGLCHRDDSRGRNFASTGFAGCTKRRFNALHFPPRGLDGRFSVRCSCDLGLWFRDFSYCRAVLGWVHCPSFRTFLLRVRGLGGSGLEAESRLNPSAAARYPPDR